MRNAREEKLVIFFCNNTPRVWGRLIHHVGHFVTLSSEALQLSNEACSALEFVYLLNEYCIVYSIGTTFIHLKQRTLNCKEVYDDLTA